jgi:hypothetical protein
MPAKEVGQFHDKFLNRIANVSILTLRVYFSAIAHLSAFFTVNIREDTRVKSATVDNIIAMRPHGAPKALRCITKTNMVRIHSMLPIKRETLTTSLAHGCLKNTTNITTPMLAAVRNRFCARKKWAARTRALIRAGSKRINFMAFHSLSLQNTGGEVTVP